MLGNLRVLRKRAGAPESLGWGRMGGVRGKEEDCNWGSCSFLPKHPLTKLFGLPKCLSSFPKWIVIFCFVLFSQWKHLHMKKSPVRTICSGWGIFFWCALNLFFSSGSQTCNSLGWVFKLQSPGRARGLDFKLTWADLRGSSFTYTP